MRLLIIEDHKELADSMKVGLEKNGFSVDVAYYGEDGEELAFVNSYDCILLDLNLPDKDGIDILRFLRRENIASPVIIVTARDEVEQRAMGLDLGADDYISKPFELLELRARVQAVIRRFHGRTNPILQVGGLVVYPDKRIAEYGGKAITLSAKEFDVLEYLAMRHPAIVSSEEIVEHVYNEEFDPFSSVLRVHLTRLRRKLMDASEKELLITHRGKGYSLCED